jgi:hypothetical protein
LESGRKREIRGMETETEWERILKKEMRVNRRIKNNGNKEKSKNSIMV